MKLVRAIIKPFKLEDVRSVLTDLGVTGMTVTEIKGYGRQKGQREIYRGAEYAAAFVPKLQLDIVVDDELVDQTIEAIVLNAATGKIGDGKVFVFDCQGATRIRTGEVGAAAL